MQSILDIGSARVFYDGLATEPMLDHPEGLAVHKDGSVWCGGERGQVYRIEPDGSSMEQVASSGGFSQGMAFDEEDNLFVCDTRLGVVMRLDAGNGAYEKFAEGGPDIAICNDLAFGPDGSLYVSDSHAFKEPGPGVFRFSPAGRSTLFTTNLGRWHLTAIETQAEGLPLHGGYGGSR